MYSLLMVLNLCAIGLSQYTSFITFTHLLKMYNQNIVIFLITLQRKAILLKLINRAAVHILQMFSVIMSKKRKKCE